MTQKQAVNHWFLSAHENRKAAEDVFKAKHPEWDFYLAKELFIWLEKKFLT